MKKILLLLILVFAAFQIKATTYHIAPSGADATTWATLPASPSAGDSVLYQRGHTYYDYISVTTSGSSGSPIVIGAYGVGSNPVISGFTNVSAFTNLGGNIWESTDAVSTLSNCRVVVNNGVKAMMGRYPNTGWLTYQTCVATTSITSSSVNSAVTDWTGANVVIREAHWLIGNYPITNHSGGTLTYSGGMFSVCLTGYGFFITNDVRTLDSQNEWYYDPSTKKLSIYSATEPTDVQVSSADSLVSILNTVAYITVQDLDFEGANSESIWLKTVSGTSTGEQHIIVQDCNFNYTGRNAITAIRSKYLTVNRCTFNNTNNNVIDMDVNSSFATITNNSFKNTALVAGEGRSGEQQGMVIDSNGSATTIQDNFIDSVGYNGMFLYNSNYLVKNNFVNHSCLLKDDGAGIYTYIGSSGTTFTNRKIQDNVVLNAIGNGAGTGDNVASARGIYLDGYTVNVEVSGNTVANCSNYGIYINGSKNVSITNNHSFNNSYQIYFHNWGGYTIQGITMTGNEFVSKTGQYCLGFWSALDSIPKFGTASGNYYARPVDDNLTFRYGSPGTTMADHTLLEWKTASSQDATSNKSSKAISLDSDLAFHYSLKDTTITLATPMVDVAGTKYNSSVTLQPYTSVVLIKNPTISLVDKSTGKIVIDKSTGKILILK